MQRGGQRNVQITAMVQPFIVFENIPRFSLNKLVT